MIEDSTSANYQFIQLNPYSLSWKSSVSMFCNIWNLFASLSGRTQFENHVVHRTPFERMGGLVCTCVENPWIDFQYDGKEEIIFCLFAIHFWFVALVSCNNLVLVYSNDVYKSFKSIEEKRFIVVCTYVAAFFFVTTLQSWTFWRRRASEHARTLVSSLSTHLIGFPFFLPSLIVLIALCIKMKQNVQKR